VRFRIAVAEAGSIGGRRQGGSYSGDMAEAVFKLDREIDNSASDSSSHPRGGDRGRQRLRLMPPGREKDRDFDLPQQRLLDSFQGNSGSVWNHFKTGFFLLPPAVVFSIDGSASPKDLFV
jgi:hypothetical protein